MPLDLSIIIPCFNEEENIVQIASKVLGIFDINAIRGEIIFVNDGSHDGTHAEIERVTKQFKNIVGIDHSKNLGITEAWNSGLKRSCGIYAVTIDADLQYNPEDILLLYKEIIKDNYDLVQGWRREYKDTNLTRRFLSRALSCLLNLLFFTKLNDIKSGFVLYKREILSDILQERKNFRVFYHFFILCALKKGYRIKQVPITFYPRIHGHSFIKNPILLSCKVLLDIPRAIFDFGIMERSKAKRRI